MMSYSPLGHRGAFALPGRLVDDLHEGIRRVSVRCHIEMAKRFPEEM